MQSAGARAWLAGRAKLAHETWTDLATGLHASALLKRVAGAERARQGGWGLTRRIAWAGGMALTPPLHMARLARSLIGRPALWPLFWISIPLLTLSYSVGAWSEAIGYLFGGGDCLGRFRDLEISIER
jgi:hypothetical protein